MAERETPRPYRVLVVDDEEVAREGLKRILRRPDLSVDLSPGGEEALDRIFAEGHDYHVVLTDYRMPRVDGKQLLEHIVAERPLTKVIIITGKGSTASAVECMKVGAYDFIEKPFDIVLIRAAVDRAIRECQLSEENLSLRKSLSLKGRGDPILLWEDPAMDRTVLLAQKLALTDDPILIEGESGTGKELLARTIHQSSRLRSRNFLAINCGALPEDLLVSELFGYEKGAFTGANETKAGLFEATAGGTLFLDEIGDLPLSMQARFLRVVEQKEVFRVGGRSAIPVEFRLVAATNKDVAKMVDDGEFRADLYYRLRVHLLPVPPLRERLSDIDLLFDHFNSVLEREGQNPVTGLSERSKEILRAYSWPGNVRELGSLVRQLAVVAGGRQVQEEDLPKHLAARPGPQEADGRPATTPETLEQLKVEHIRQALEKTQGNRTHAARLERPPDCGDQGAKRPVEAGSAGLEVGVWGAAPRPMIALPAATLSLIQGYRG
ncbi:MAG: sigma-54-dependent Fis family transcriptional regulator [Candidatus Riflebacteria bacterium]|nr:sigma-54-dependent Fis family transcriptional regulator [Candidatus Riflebacteria bacterium]